MNKLEHRLNAAAEETRQLARQRPITRFVGRPASRYSGALILASAFAVVILLFGLLPFMIGGRNRPTDPGADSAPSTSVATPTTVAATEGTTPGEGCSAEGVPLPGAAQGLPAPVADTRDAIISAAAACDLAALDRLASDTFTTSFGGGGVENLRVWEERGEGPLGTLLRLLDMRYELDDGGEIYVWPAAATYESWDQIPEADIDELSAIYTEGELDQIAGLGSYAGWRTGIDQDGNWLYFVAGD